MKLHPIVQEKLPEVLSLLRKHKIKTAFVFGSAVSPWFGDKSDIDLLINFKDGIDPLEAGEHWWTLHDELRDLFNREIDLVTERSLKNPYFISELDNTKVMIYG
jgi:predicted nucleotidyltransferase